MGWPRSSQRRSLDKSVCEGVWVSRCGCSVELVGTEPYPVLGGRVGDCNCNATANAMARETAGNSNGYRQQCEPRAMRAE